MVRAKCAKFHSQLFLPILALACMPALLHARGANPKRATMDANLLYREHRYADAVAMAKKNSKKIDSRNISLLMDNYSIWQRSLIALEKYDEAVEVGLLAQQSSRHDYRIIQGLGEAYYLASKGEEALPYLQRYAALKNADEYTGRVYYYMGEIYLKQGRYQHADIAFSTAIYHSSSDYRWWYRLGFTREMANNKAGARKAYEQALSINPNFTEVKNRLNSL